MPPHLPPLGTRSTPPATQERRAPLRPAHFEYAKGFAETGKLKMGGAFDPPSDGALLLFQADKAEVEEFAKNDPYVQGGLVTEVTVKPWSVVIGGDGFQA